jgi:hypothetical protein
LASAITLAKRASSQGLSPSAPELTSTHRDKDDNTLETNMQYYR